MARGRNTVALLVDYIDPLWHGYESALRRALGLACSKRNLNLMIVAGRPFQAPEQTGAARNSVYALMHPDCVDGLILVAGALARYCDIEGLRRICQDYRPLPICSAGVCVPEVPSVVTDAGSGVTELVDHLVVDHGCHQIAYIAGPEGNSEARTRLASFEDALRRHALPNAPQLFARADFTKQRGAQAMQEILNRGVEFDAVVAANDGMALGACETLHQRGLRVPQDVRVVGFDDLEIARLHDPALSTVCQPLKKLADYAVEAIAGQISGRPVSPLTTLYPELVLRQSCGCHSDNPEQSLAAGAPRKTPVPGRAGLGNLFQTQLRLSELVGSEAGNRLLQSLLREMDGRQGAFLSALERLLAQSADNLEGHRSLEDAISLLRRELGEQTSADLEELWHVAQRLVAAAHSRAHSRKQEEIDFSYRQLLGAGERFATAPDAGALRQFLASELINMQIRTACFCLYLQNRPGFMEAFLCLRQGRIFQPDEEIFKATQLLPDGAWPEASYPSLVLPLAFEAEALGVAVFELTSRPVIHEMLCEQLSVALIILRSKAR